VEEAVGHAVAGLGGDASLVLFFPDGALDPAAAAREAAGAAGDVALAGMTAGGAIAASGSIERGCSALAFGGEIAAGVGVAEEASADPRGAGRTAARDALRGLDPDDGNRLLVLLIDTISGDQAHVVAGAYESAGPHVPLIGGAAGGRVPAQIAGSDAGRDRVVAVALASKRPIGVGIGHGCAPLATPAIVTRADGRVVQRLDGRSAETVYLEKLGCAEGHLSDEEFAALATVHPLAQPELRGDVRLRHVLGRAGGGGLEAATHIPENAAIEFTEQTPEAIVRSTFDAVSDALKPLGDLPAQAALVFDCAGRREALGGPGPMLSAEVEALVGSFGSQPPELAGVYTRGEIGRVHGAKGDRNHAVVVAAFG
jgi:hypothetical protein